MQNNKTLKTLVLTVICALCVLSFAGQFAVAGAQEDFRAFTVDNGEIEVEKNFTDGAGSLGTKVTLKNGGTVNLTYENLIDVKDADELISFRILPQKIDKPDFKQIYLILTDSVDPEQVLTVALGTGSTYYSINGTTAHAGFCSEIKRTGAGNVTIVDSQQNFVGLDRFVGGLANGGYTAYGVVNAAVFPTTSEYFKTGHYWGTQYPYFANESGNTVPVNVGISTGKVVLNGITVADLKDSNFLRVSSEKLATTGLQGKIKARYTTSYVDNLFSSGKIRLTVRVEQAAKNSAINFMAIGKKNSTEQSEDHTAPVVFAEKQKTLGVKGLPYAVASATAVDNVDGEVEVTTTVKSPEGNPVALTDGKFVPTGSGEYSVIYRASDLKGNEQVTTVKILVADYLPTTEFTLLGTLPQTVGTGKIITIPSAVATSEIAVQSGKLEVYALVQKDDKVVGTFTDMSAENEFRFTSAGKYQIAYVAPNAYALSAKVFEVEVEDAPVINVAKEVSKTENVGRNVFFDLGKTEGVFGDETSVLTPTVIGPDGNDVELFNGGFAPSEIGDYVLRYEFTSGGQTCAETVTLHSVIINGSLFENDADIIDIIGNVPTPEFCRDETSGVLISANSPGATATFKNKIDLNTLTKTDALFSLYSMDGDGYTGASTIVITLTDAYDSKNTVEFSSKRHETMPQYAYVNVNYDGRTLARNTENGGKIMSLPQFGCLVNFYQYEGSKATNVRPLSIQSDYENKAFYIDPNGYAASGKGSWLLLDLDDTDQIGMDNEWKGFTTGEVYLSVTFKTVEAKSAVLVTEIAGKPVCGFAVSDDCAPEIYLDLKDTFEENDGKIPDAKVGGEYAIPSARANDLICGECPVVTTLVKDGTTENLVDGVSNGVFVPQSAGRYDLTYVSTDDYGNEKKIEYYFEAKSSISPVEVEFASAPLTAYAGSKYVLPALSVSGGSGKLIAQSEIQLNGKTILPDGLSRYLLYEVGTLTVHTTVTDYLGTQIGSGETLSIPVVANEKPVIDVVGVPHAVVSGQKLFLPDFTAINYNYGKTEQGYIAYGKITVNGTTVYSCSPDGTTTGSLVYVPESTQNKLTVCYLAGDTPDANDVSKQFVVDVLTPEYISDFMIPYDVSTGERDDSGMTVSRAIGGSAFSFNSERGLRLPQLLVADGLTLRLSVPSTANNLGYFDVVMTDSGDEDTKILFRVAPSGNGATLEVNGNSGKKVAINGSFTQDKQFYLVFNNGKSAICTEDGTVIDYVLKTVGGASFRGFPSNKIKLEIELREVTGAAALNVVQVANQSFAAVDPDDKFTDLNGPVIRFDEPIVSKTVSIGDKFTVPAAEALDVLSSGATVTVSVKTPDGKTIEQYNGVPADRSFEITTAAYGYYRVIYLANDVNGRRTTKTINIYVKDEVKPTISVSGSVPTKIKLGESVLVPSATTNDNHSEVSLFVYVVSPGTTVKAVTPGENFTPDKKGKFKLVYYCYDFDYNTAISEFEFVVE